MEPQQVKEFFNSVKEGTNSKIIELLENDQQTIGKIIDGLMSQENSEITELVYSSLFPLYQHGSDIQKAFVLHFLPALVWEYLLLSSNHEKNGYGKLEAVLLAIYNAEVVDEDGETRYQKFRLPSLSRPSLYHEPSFGKSTTSALTESALSRHEQSAVVYRLAGPGYQLTRIPACHRFAVIAFVLEQYNMYIAFMGEASLKAACKMALRTASCGFKNLCQKYDDGEHLESFSKCSRVPLNNASIVQLVYITHYAMFNGFSKPAQSAFEALHFRAAHGLFSPAYLLTCSIEHLLQSDGGQALMHTPLGLSIHTTSSQSECKQTADSSDKKLPRCLDTCSIPWKRRCPYEMLIAQKSIPCKLEVDSTPLQSTSKDTEGAKLKILKDSRPKKTKSWGNVSIGKATPGASPTKSPGFRETTPVSPRAVSLQLNERKVENIELLTGL